MVHIHLKRTLLGTLITSLLVSAVLAIVIFLFAKFGAVEMKALFSALDIGACCLAGLCCLTIYNTPFKWFSIFGIIISAVCMCWLLGTIWAKAPLNDYNVLLSLVVLLGTCAHLSLVLITRAMTITSKIILGATVIFITAVAVLLIVIIWRDNLPEFYYRLLGVFGILDVIGTIVSPSIGRKKRLEDVI